MFAAPQPSPGSFLRSAWATVTAMLTFPLLTAQGQLDPVHASVDTRMEDFVRAVGVPGTGHWLVEEIPGFVTAELLEFLDG
ncbi:hypothetical protein [Nocardiopsis oceani]